MKFYETTADEYIASKERYNLHPEMKAEYFPTSLKTFENMVLYGPSGSGKYTQVLSILKRFSPSELKYEKKITVQSEKQTYIFKMSDIHYEIDMSFLGCNSKTLWHDVFFQIVDIISVKSEKIGVIICKQFHMIHSELLEIFYSYMQRLPQVSIKFILLTEHISFLPNNILNACAIISMKKPVKSQLKNIANERFKEETFIKRISGGRQKPVVSNILYEIDTTLLLNIKELSSFELVESVEELPKDVFNTICDQIIRDIENIDNIPFTEFRDSLYDIMVYNLDVVECVWYILTHFIQSNKITGEKCSMVLIKIFPFLQYFNNNYRPIYHLENIMFYIIKVIKDE
jgi:energy-coupling factor transporter ATP-binding protein EcfA2